MRIVEDKPAVRRPQFRRQVFALAPAIVANASAVSAGWRRCCPGRPATRRKKTHKKSGSRMASGFLCLYLLEDSGADMTICSGVMGISRCQTPVAR